MREDWRPKKKHNDQKLRHLTRGLGGEGGLIRQVEKESTNGL